MSTQLTPFTATRDYRRFDRELHADLANPWLVRAQQAARALGEARGWSRWITSDVNRALVIVLSGFHEGESIRYSELFPALRLRGLAVVRTAEALDLLGLFTDDRAPAVDYSSAAVWRLLHRHGWSWQYPARRTLERDEQAVGLWTKDVWPQAE